MIATREAAGRARRALGATLRGLAAAGVAAWVAGCSTTGHSFDTTQMSRIVPGQTTLPQAVDILKAPPENTYRHHNGAVMARWAHKATLVADAMYFRRELWLQFGADGTFQHVADRVNVMGETGQAAIVQPRPDRVAAGLPSTMPAGFPYGMEPGRDTVVSYPVY